MDFILAGSHDDVKKFLKSIGTSSPINIKITCDTQAFMDPKKTNPNALPRAVSFNYTWKEE